MSWGKGILITIIVFVVGTAVMMIIAMNSPDDLVMNNYYEKGVKYQQQIDKINRTNALKENVKMEFTGNAVFIQMPSFTDPARIKGEVLFYRPSNAAEDVKVSFAVDSSRSALISTANLEKGFWKLKLNWSIDTTQYFNETTFTIN